MIRKLRRKFIMILMGVVTLILLAVFLSTVLSTRNANRAMSEAMLRQALSMPAPMPGPGFRPPAGESGAFPFPDAQARARTPLLVVELGANGEAEILTNQLYFLEETEVAPLIRAAMGTAENRGILPEQGMRFQKSADGLRIAFADVTVEQEMLGRLIVTSLFVGFGALLLFFFISLALSRWAVEPVAQAWRRQQQFVQDASHELKTPLTVILSNADMLGGPDTFADEKKARRVTHIQAEARRMKKLVEDLLTLARSDSAKEPQPFARTDFSFIVTHAILTFEAVIYDEKKALRYAVPENLFVRGDAQRLEQLVAILLDNAVKYSPPGGEIRVSLCETPKKVILLTVANDGDPIPGEELSQVFLRFYQADKSRSAHGSYGLGLSIAQGIVRAHGGRIWASSDAAAGNSFHVSLPAAQ